MIKLRMILHGVFCSTQLVNAQECRNLELNTLLKTNHCEFKMNKTIQFNLGQSYVQLGDLLIFLREANNSSRNVLNQGRVFKIKSGIQTKRFAIEIQDLEIQSIMLKVNHKFSHLKFTTPNEISELSDHFLDLNCVESQKIEI